MLKFLIIRRDNIGDLVCTTPAISMLRNHFPDSYIAVLANSYNGPALFQNPDLDALFMYTKNKHRSNQESFFSIMWNKYRTLFFLRKLHFDYIIYAQGSFNQNSWNLGRFLKPKKTIGYGSFKKGDKTHFDAEFDPNAVIGKHEARKVCHLLSVLGIEDDPPPLRVVASPAEKQWARLKLRNRGFLSQKYRIAISISSRKAHQRWPIRKWAKLIEMLQQLSSVGIVILWSPGEADNPCHPGDDLQIKQLIAQIPSNLCIVALPTQNLRELIGAFYLCNLFIGSDGGAMHLAAGVGLPCVALFGHSQLSIWHPWKVPYRIIQAPLNDVSNIQEEEVFNKVLELLA